MNKQYAILFKGEKFFSDDGDEIVSYEPVEVLEGTIYGTYFQAFDGRRYYHITEEFDQEYAYAFPQTESNLLISFGKKSPSEIRKILLNNASKYQYCRNYMTNDVYMSKLGETDGYILKDSQVTLIDQIKMIQHDLEESLLPKAESKIDTLGKKREQPKNNTQSSKLMLNLDIQKMYDYVSSRIIGQDAPIKKIIASLYQNYTSSDAKNMLITGPSGVGKTKTLELLSEIMEVPLSIIDVASFTSSGYVGRSVDEILSIIYHNAKGNLALAENSIVVLDEIDKKAGSDPNTRSNVSKQDVLNELLGYLSGGNYLIKTSLSSSININTSNMTFICLGACAEMKKGKPLGFQSTYEVDASITNQDFFQYGFTKEFIRRLPVKIRMNALSENELKNILLYSEISPLKKEQKYYQDHFKVNLILEDEVIDYIARGAVKLETGASSLEEMLKKVLDEEIIFDLASHKEEGRAKKLILTKEVIDNPKKYILR